MESEESLRKLIREKFKEFTKEELKLILSMLRKIKAQHKTAKS